MRVLKRQAGLLDTRNAYTRRWPRATWSTIPVLTVQLSIAGCGQDFTHEPSIDPADWPHYGRDLAATKYSPLDQVSAANVD